MDLSDEALELERIKRLLDEANVPKEVFIGTNSVVDRVEWTLNRLRNFEEHSKVQSSKVEYRSFYGSYEDDWP